MKILSLSAVLCLVATATAAMGDNANTNNKNGNLDDTKRVQNHREIKGVETSGHPIAVMRHEKEEQKKKHNEHGLEAHNDGGGHHYGGQDKEGENGDKKDVEGDKKDVEGDKKDVEGDKKDVEGDKKGVEGDKKGVEGDKKGGEGDKKDLAAGGEDAATAKDGKTTTSAPIADANPLWLVQPYGASVWEQGRDYVIVWGPNPDPIFAKTLKEKTPIDIKLMQGPPEHLTEISVLKTNEDSSVHAFQWTVPKTLTPAKDYSIRLSHDGQVDTYSHYFEVVPAGDARSTKSNVGEPLQMPQKGDVAKPLDKGDIYKPAAPPNPFPAEKPAASNPPPKAAKPAAHVSAAEAQQGGNMLAFAMTLFGAVYFL